MEENKKANLNLGDLELQIMNLVWDKKEPCSVTDIHEALYPQNKRAYTTIMTVMGNLYKKGVLGREKRGNAYIYFPLQKKEDIAENFIKKIGRYFFNNNIPEFLSCFLKSQDKLKPGEIEELRKQIRDFEAGE